MRIEKHEKSRKWTDMLALIFSVPKQRYQSCKWMGEKRRLGEKSEAPPADGNHAISDRVKSQSCPYSKKKK